MKRSNSDNVAVKICALVQQHGWTQDEFARRAGVNRHTARKIMIMPRKAGKLQNATVAACAEALGLPVHELRERPLDQFLLPWQKPNPYEVASQPQLAAWLKRHAERASQLTEADLDELYSLHGTGGPLTDEGIEHYIERIERRRQVVQQVEAIAGTEYLDQLEKQVAKLYAKIQVPGRSGKDKSDEADESDR